jgi:hypothetical protein
MRRAHWSARPHSARAARIAVPLALALVVGLVLGLKLIGSDHTSFGLSAAGTGACATPSAAASTASVTPSPTVSASSAVAAGTTQAESASLLSARGYHGRRHWRRHWSGASPTASASATTTAVADPTTAATASATPCPTSTASASASASPTATAPAAAVNVSCDIIVPADPLSAAGLATPYQLTGPDGMSPAASGCTTVNSANLGAFVQATILDPTTGALSVYEPLVITQGTTPAIAPVVPTLPAGAIVTVDLGFNGTDLTQVGATPTALQEGNCVNGLHGSIFGQQSFCNGTQFFQAVATAEAAGLLKVPALGTATKTGDLCLTTRNFRVIDQDPSDNVTTTYLLTASGQTAQFNAANVAALPGATDLVNGSDNKLMTSFLDPTIGCTPYEAPDLSQGGVPGTSQALDEIQAAADQPAPVALVPENDEMVLDNNGNFSKQKTDQYRSNIGEDPIMKSNDQTSSPENYCQNMVNIQTPWLNTNQALLATGQSPVPAVGDNLLTFMANRLSMSFTNLNCQLFGLTNPVTVTLNGDAVAVAATFNVTQQTATAATATPMPTASPTVAAPTATPAPGQRIGRRHHLLMDPSGM